MIDMEAAVDSSVMDAVEELKDNVEGSQKYDIGPEDNIPDGVSRDRRYRRDIKL